MLEYVRILVGAQRARMDERGASAVEYGLLIAGIAAVIVTVIFAFSGYITGLFDDTCAAITNKGVATENGATKCT